MNIEFLAVIKHIISFCSERRLGNELRMKETAEKSQRIYFYKIGDGFLLQDNGKCS